MESKSKRGEGDASAEETNLSQVEVKEDADSRVRLSVLVPSVRQEERQRQVSI